MSQAQYMIDTDFFITSIQCTAETISRSINYRLIPPPLIGTLGETNVVLTKFNFIFDIPHE